MKFDSKEAFDSFMDEWDIGNIAESRGYMSTTKNAKPLDSFQNNFLRDANSDAYYVAMKINGLSGRDISGASMAVHENEVLFPRKTMFRTSAKRMRADQ